MSTLSQLISLNKHRPFRKLYIKRKDTDGNFEGSWVRIDNNTQYKDSRVINWGSTSIEIDHDPGQIGSFEASSLNMTLDNSDGYFNVETDEQSKWFGYLNRKFTKLKVDVGYLDVDGSEVGEATVFEGFIDRLEIFQEGIASVSSLGYQSILSKFNINDLSLTGSDTISNTVDAIMNQAKVIEYIPFVSSVPSQNKTITDTSLLAGTYWDVLRELAYISNSVILLNGSTFSFVARTVGVSSVFDFKGAGSDNNPNILEILFYDDEGADRVRVYWKESNSALTSISADATLLSKYLNDPQSIDLSALDSGDRQDVLDSYLSNWEDNKPIVEFSTKFLINIVSPLDKITIETYGEIVPKGLTGRWDAFEWDDGTVWGRFQGAINILSSESWMVTRVEKNINDWVNIIKVEKVV